MSLAPANPAQSRIEIGAWRLRKSKWSAILFVMICPYRVWLWQPGKTVSSTSSAFLAMIGEGRETLAVPKAQKNIRSGEVFPFEQPPKSHLTSMMI